MSEIIKVKNLTKKYDGRKVVKGISFSVNEGEVFGILGQNGAGKSTTLEMLETLRPIDSGEVILDGINAKKNPAAIKKIIGIQLQNTAFMAKLNLREQLKMFAGLYG